MRRSTEIMTFLVLFSLAAGPMYAQSTDQVSCFVCGRTPADYTEIFKVYLSDLDQAILEAEDHAQRQKQNFYSRYAELIRDVKGIPKANLAFTVETVKTDLPAFRRMIPRLDEILAFNEEHLGGRNNSLGDIVDSIIQGNIGTVTGPFNYINLLENQKENLLILQDELFEHNFVEVTFEISDLIDTKQPHKQLVLHGENRKYLNQSPRSMPNPEDLLLQYNQFKTEINDASALNAYEKIVLLSEYMSAAIRGPYRPKYTVHLCPICYKLYLEAVQIVHPEP